MAKQNYKKVGEKFCIVAVEVVLAGLAVHFTGNQTWIVAVPVLEALRNWWKHR